MRVLQQFFEHLFQRASKSAKTERGARKSSGLMTTFSVIFELPASKYLRSKSISRRKIFPDLKACRFRFPDLTLAILISFVPPPEREINIMNRKTHLSLCCCKVISNDFQIIYCFYLSGLLKGLHSLSHSSNPFRGHYSVQGCHPFYR
ncbi:hypothetical protein Mal35_17040 [Gimesia maris]|nr:hypothetical protein Mal35_17040 [Gimesia maris]